MASVNGKQVYQLQEALYFAETKVVVESGGLYISNADSRTKLVLKLRNVSADVINALRISVRCMDAFGDDLGEFQHQYIDLEAGTGKSFGDTVLVDVPQGSTRSISVMITAIIYANGRSWRMEIGEAGVALPKAQPLPYGPEALEEWRSRTGCSQALDQLQTAEGLWRCTCGAWNPDHSLRCGECGVERSALQQMPGEDELKNAYAARQMAARRAEEAARLQAENERRAAEEKARKEREAAERAAKEEVKKRKKKRRRTVRRVLLLLFLIAVVAAFPIIRIAGARILLNADQPEMAYKVITFLEEYNYVEHIGIEPEYVRGEVFITVADKELEAGNLEAARKYYEMVDLYESARNERERAKQAQQYFTGLDALKSGDKKGALSAFLNCSNFNDAALRCAELYIELGEYTNAVKQLSDKVEYAQALADLREAYVQVDFVKRIQDKEPVTFGAYTGKDRTEVIEWVRLPGRAFIKELYLVSKEILFNRTWDSSSSVTTWANSDLRAYLNNEFMQESFTEGERKAIVPMAYTLDVSSTTKSRITWTWPAEKASTDYVTLPSAAEAADYFVSSKASGDPFVTTDTNATYFWSRNITDASGKAGLLPLTRNSSTNFSTHSSPVTAVHGVRPALTANIDVLADLYAKTLEGNALVAEGKYAEGLEVLKQAGSPGWESELYATAMIGLEEVRNSDADLETRINMYEAVGRIFEQIPGFLNTKAEEQRAVYEFGLLCAEAGQTKDAIEALTFAGDYQDAKQQIASIILAKAESLRAEGDYLGANEWLQQLPAEQVQEHINENLCSEAEVVLAQNQYLEARRRLKELAGFARADELLAQTPAFAMLDTISSMETLTLGSFEQDGNVENGKEPVEWIILSKDETANGCLLLISRDVLTSRAWDENKKAANWSASSLHKWLNGEFLTATFNARENALLLNMTTSSKTKTNNHQSEGYVRLLTLDEAAKYFSTVEESRAAFSTAAALAYEPNISKDYWWLCDVQSSGAVGMPFNTRQGISYNYMMVTIDAILGVRPVIAVNMNALVDVLMAEQEVAALMEAGDFQAVLDQTDLTSAWQYQQSYAKAMLLRQQIETADAAQLQGLYKQYTMMLSKAGGYADAAQLYAEGCYRYAELLAEAGNYREASNQYTQAGDYKDAPQLVESLRVRQALQAIAERSYAEAYSLLTGLADNAEAEQMLREDSHMVEYARLINELAAGNTFIFGRYEQDSSKANGAEPIVWRVLDQAEDSRALLLADQILTHRAFDANKRTTWDKAHIRTWLNDEFANEAFTANELNTIILASVDEAMPGNAQWGYQYKPVENRVFLLSLGEAMIYFDTAEASAATCTSSAMDSYPYSDGKANLWLTRSTDREMTVTALLPFTDLLANKSSANFSTTPHKNYRGIRPAMWVSIEQLVSMNTALADGLALKESGAYAEALKVLALSNAPEAAAAILEIHFILGEQAMAEGRYESACAEFETAAEYPGAAERLQAARYALANEQEEAARYTEAIGNYTLAGNWQDAAERISACYYKHGMALLEKQEFDAAVEALIQAGDAEDAKTMILRAYYEKADKLERGSDYAAALDSFILADGWQDAAARQQESRYLLAQTMLTNHQYVNAQEQLALLKGYKDADALAQQYLDAAHEETIRTAWSVGNLVKFGSTEQDNNLANGAESIEWRVLHVDGDRVLLLADKILAYRAFDSESNLWVTSDLRAWLNNDFLTSTFTAQEKDCLRLTTQYNGKNSRSGSSLVDEEDTEDWVFLLNLAEAVQYLPSAEESRAKTTTYAWAQNTDRQRSKYQFNWWMRTAYSTYSKKYTGILPFTNDEFSYQATDYAIAAVGVRPAIWVDVAKIIDMTR